MEPPTPGTPTNPTIANANARRECSSRVRDILQDGPLLSSSAGLFAFTRHQCVTGLRPCTSRVSFNVGCHRGIFATMITEVGLDSAA